MDLSNLHKAVVSAVEADKRYQLENDAKFRAVEQGVESYDQFAALVKSCHLKPLDKKESLSGLSRSGQSWNYTASCGSNTHLAAEVGKYFPRKNRRKIDEITAIPPDTTADTP